MEKYMHGMCSILIYSNNISCETISNIIGINPSHVINKGDITSKALKTYAPKNGWFYDIQCNSLEEIDEALQKVSKIYLRCADELDKYRNIEVRIRCFVNSALAQIGFGISSETLSLLAKTKREFEISVFSWGGVEE